MILGRTRDDHRWRRHFFAICLLSIAILCAACQTTRLEPVGEHGPVASPDDPRIFEWQLAALEGDVPTSGLFPGEPVSLVKLSRADLSDPKGALRVRPRLWIVPVMRGSDIVAWYLVTRSASGMKWDMGGSGRDRFFDQRLKAMTKLASGSDGRVATRVVTGGGLYLLVGVVDGELRAVPFRGMLGTGGLRAGLRWSNDAEWSRAWAKVKPMRRYGGSEAVRLLQLAASSR